MYRALYRKWRPQKFSDVVGQEAITTALANQVQADKIGHAYLFTGTRGTGKTSCAKILAMAANCESREGAEPCGHCPMCEGMENGSVLDVMEIDAASNNGVDDVRDLREETVYRPSRGRYRVYIIDEVHMLTTQAFNALLKTLEEPPAHVIFILATTEIHKVPATILSRCQRFDFGRIDAEKIAARLLYIAGQEGITLTEGAADLLARLGDGSMRDATSLLDTCAGVGEAVDEALVRKMAGVSDKSYLFELSGAAQRGDSQKLLELVGGLRSQSIDVRRLCEELVAHYRNLMLAAARADGSLMESVPAADRQRYLDEAKAVPERTAIAAMRRLAGALDKMSRSPDPRIELELALFDIAEQNGAGSAKAAPPSPQPVTQAPAQAPIARPLQAAPRLAEIAAAKPVATPPEEVPFEVAAAPPEIPPASPAATPPAPAQMAAPETRPNAASDIEPEAAPETHAAPQQEMTAQVPQAAAQPAESQSGPVLFVAWPEVLQRMNNVDKMLYSYMRQSTAYEDGKFVLIDGGDVFLTFIRTNADAKERIRTVIAEVTGKRYNLGPYEAPKQAEKQQVTAEDTLKAWEAMGVEVKYE
ncbi:DNA polymerase III subunit gamma/tau [Ruminococcaceae bacterium OttesenSCG-928-D13]|nr:DNA polymerase III subunit gamma/tau [Ruminococcaceae bacterium OttesenSCG-928-D13]